ncbi:hypothetical protein F511_23209 [Dorcoceras hygrometricum]|uniref:Uncharacterized protein n=1 Tax=Dorcoceras hygrometricum TaxID=472368 RepID=A0A2Z7CZL0_9LAMI|nr:hypothetical protein F511_23209 [Dorcoceras hygrometricum]
MRKLNQQLRVSAPAHNNLQKGYRMKELLKRGPTLPQTYQTVAGHDGKCRRNATTLHQNAAFHLNKTASHKPKSWSLTHRQDSLALTKTTTHSLRHPVASSHAKQPDASYRKPDASYRKPNASYRKPDASYRKVDHR